MHPFLTTIKVAFYTFFALTLFLLLEYLEQTIRAQKYGLSEEQIDGCAVVVLLCIPSLIVLRIMWKSYVQGTALKQRAFHQAILLLLLLYAAIATSIFIVNILYARAFVTPYTYMLLFAYPFLIGTIKKQ